MCSLICILGVYSALALPVALQGNFNPDEGIYLHAAWRLMHGELPYKDYAFPQPPLILIPHGIIQLIFGPGFYVGRVASLAIGALLLLSAAMASRFFFGPWSGVLTGVLLGFSPWFVVHMVNVSTFPLAGIFLVALVMAVAYRRWMLAGALAMAVGWTRTPFALAVPLLCAWSAYQHPRHGWLPLRRTFLGMSITAVVLMGPFLVFFPSRTVENLVGHHITARQGLADKIMEDKSLGPLWDGLQPYLISIHLPAYRWPLAIGAVAVIGLVFMRRVPAYRGIRSFMICTLLLAFGISLAQAPSRGVTYDTPLLPLLAVVSGVGVVALIQRLPSSRSRRLAFLLTVVGLCCGTYWSQRGVFAGAGEQEESPRSVRRVADYIETHTKPTDFILTPELYVAVEAGRRALPGMGLGRFFYAPEFSRERAERAGVLNASMFLERVRSRQAAMIVLNHKHFWNRLSKRAEDRERVLQDIETAGYRRVESLHTFLPTVENLLVYERQ